MDNAKANDVDPEEELPLNGMVVGNLKEVIVRKFQNATLDIQTQPKEYIYTLRQYWLGLGTTVVALSSGMTAGFSAILLPQLLSEESDIVITKHQGSWIASMAALPMMLGCLCSSYPMDKLGRKLAVIGSCIVFTIGWAVLALATNHAALYAGRFITGFAVGLLSPMVQVYIAETSVPKHRGILLSGAPLAVAGGILLSHVFGTFLKWQPAAGLCGIPPLLCILLLIPIPESPAWLLLRSQTEKAETSYKWFHGSLDSEWLQILEKSQQQTQTTTNTSVFKSALQGSFLKPLAVLLVFFFVQQFSGVIAVAFYTVDIMKKVLPHIDEYIAMISIDIVRLIVSIVGVLLLRKFGRKSLAITSAIGSAISLLGLALYLGADIVKLFLPHWIPLFFLITYVCFVSIGLVPLPWVLIGEVFSKELRGLGSGIASSFCFICYFSVVRAAPDLFELIGAGFTFGFFGVVCLVGAVILWGFLPETKDKTLSEIEAFYEKRTQKPKV